MKHDHIERHANRWCEDYRDDPWLARVMDVALILILAAAMLLVTVYAVNNAGTGLPV